MKIRAQPKVSHGTLLYTTIYTYLNQNNHPKKDFWHTLLINKIY